LPLSVVRTTDGSRSYFTFTFAKEITDPVGDYFGTNSCLQLFKDGYAWLSGECKQGANTSTLVAWITDKTGTSWQWKYSPSGQTVEGYFVDETEIEEIDWQEIPYAQ
jgi:hypothetical protein